MSRWHAAKLRKNLCSGGAESADLRQELVLPSKPLTLLHMREPLEYSCTGLNHAVPQPPSF